MHLWPPNYDKVGAAVQRGKVISSRNSAESIDCRGKNLSWPLLHTQKISSRLIVDLNVKIRTTKLSGRNVGYHLYRCEIDRSLLNRTQRLLSTMKNLIKFSILKLRAFVLQNTSFKRVQKQLTA